MHVWGAPVYVLDPKLQQGKKLPRWQPRSRRGIFVGFSNDHSSDVPLVLNLTTGSISPQYHVVFDDEFSTVPSIDVNEDPPTFWNDLDLESQSQRIYLDPESPHQLHEEWLTPDELEERRRTNNRQRHVRQIFPPLTGSSTDNTTPAPIPASTQITPSNTPTAVPTELPVSEGVQSSSTTQQPVVPEPNSHRRSNRLNPTSPRRSSRSSKGTHENRYIPEAFLTSVLDPSRNHNDRILAYNAELHSDLNTGSYLGSDPRCYAAKHRLDDPDNPSYNDALSGEHAQDYEEAMIKEITQLIKQRCWDPILRSKVPPSDTGQRRPILKGTWAFKLKRSPDGSPLKFKARYCVRGDLQREGVDYFETYAPVVQWSTVRLLLTMVLTKNWTTKQVDYTNAFAQAKLKEEVYIEPPRGFGRKDKQDMVLKLINSLYGLKQAPKTFFEKLRDGLLERGFTQSILDPCLFMKSNMICVVYVDDTIIAGPDSSEIEALISSLGVATDEQRHSFELRDEGEVGDFLGIRIEKGRNNSFILSQSGLIDKVLRESSMESANTAVTPATTTPLHIDSEGASFDEPWEYAAIVGMLMFLATNSRPDIAYAVNQCARFTHCPRDSHAVAVKRIVRYLKGTRTKGMILHPSSSLNVDCFVDADFAGLWKSENKEDPISVKSRSGHLIMFMGCPLLWKSKLQTQIALSTMEAEYIALSNAMRDLIGVREILKEISANVFLTNTDPSPEFRTISKTFGKIPQSIVHEDNEACLKFASMPKMTPRTKHIAIPYHFFRSKVANLEIKVVGINTDNQLADQFTKGLPQDKFIKDRKNLMGW